MGKTMKLANVKRKKYKYNLPSEDIMERRNK